MGEGGIKSVLRLFHSYNYFSFKFYEAMVTDQLIKKHSFTMLYPSVSKIRQIQQEVISENLNVISGNLLQSVQEKPVEIEGTERQIYYMSVLPYMRFLDIRFRQDLRIRRKLSIYNRVIWGYFMVKCFLIFVMALLRTYVSISPGNFKKDRILIN